MFRHFVHQTLLASLIMIGSISTAIADDAFVARPEVKNFIQMMVKKHHFNQQQLTELFKQVKIRPQVMKAIKKPMEKEPWRLYQMMFVSQSRIKHGVEFWEKYKTVLERAEKEYNVPASIIVATIGVETRYGERTGNHRVIDALSNLAFSGSPRAGFFRKELAEFLLLSREQKLNPLTVMGSYAGAIGQPQFMPSSYRYYAVNFSGTGKTDLINDEEDVIGSIANYYHKHGWSMNRPVAVQADLYGGRFSYFWGKTYPKRPLTIGELPQYGITPKVKIINKDLKVKVIELDNIFTKEYWLSFPNFDVIKRYNSSDLYAMAVYQLSYHIRVQHNLLEKK